MVWKVSEIYEPEKRRTSAQETHNLGIKDWAEDDRPREKLMRNGVAVLSDAELLAILIGSGNRKETAVDLMKRLLNDCDNNLAVLSKRSLDTLMTYDGIGEAKAITILAACELGRRREMARLPERPQMDSAQKIYDYLWPKMRDLDVEEAYVMLMNQAFRLMDCIPLSHGGITETAVDVRVIIRHAIMANATVVALVHNHPSGNVKPSRDDDRLTNMVREACKTMRIHFADHVVVADGDYYSYRENGKL